MKARLVKFGEIEVEGKRYTHDVVIDGGKVRKRKKGPSKQFREKFGHTPLSAGEEIPWGGKRLVVGTGALVDRWGCRFAPASSACLDQS